MAQIRFSKLVRMGLVLQGPPRGHQASRHLLVLWLGPKLMASSQIHLIGCQLTQNLRVPKVEKLDNYFMVILIHKFLLEDHLSQSYFLHLMRQVQLLAQSSHYL